MQKHRGLTLVDLAPNKPSTAEFRLAVAVSFFKTVVEHKWPLVTNLRGSTYREGLPHHRRPMKDTLSTAIKPSGPLNSQQQEFEKQLRSRLSQTNINQMDWCGIWEGRGGQKEKRVSLLTPSLLQTTGGTYRCSSASKPLLTIAGRPKTAVRSPDE